MAHEIFITGATGFLGRRLLSELLRQTDSQFAVLVRSSCAEQMLTKHFRATDLNRVRFIHGDVTLPGLGLDSHIQSSLAHSVTEVWHLAASTSFDESKREEVFRANVEGSRNLLDVLRRFDRLDCLYHMSTAYVCGKKLGCIPEGPFYVPHGFKNPYEESKHKSEEIIRSSGLPIAILRPSITLGDSRTGDNGGDNRMMYGYALGLLRAAMHAFASSAAYWDYWRDGHAGHRGVTNVDARLLVRAEAFKNTVTLDDVVSVCLAVWQSGRAAGRTYNIVNPNNITCGQIVDAIQRAVRVTGYTNDPNLTPETMNKASVVERAAYRHTRLFWPYCLNTEPHWETGNVDALPVKRVTMTPELFEALMYSFVRSIAPPSNPSASTSKQ